MLSTDRPPRRPRLSARQRQRVLERYQRSRLTQAAFAARQGVGLSTLARWLRQQREAPAPERPAVQFQEVILPARGQRWAAEVVSPQGWTVRVAENASPETWPVLLQALPC